MLLGSADCYAHSHPAGQIRLLTMGPTVGQLMSEQHISHEEDEEDEEDEEEEEVDDFVPRRRRNSSSGGQEKVSTKRARYSPSAPNGYAPASPRPAAPSRSQPFVFGSGPSHAQSSLLRPPPSGKPPLEHSILNVEPMDEFIHEIANFIHRLIANRTDPVEIEAKVGVLRDGSGQRLSLPIGAETSMSHDEICFCPIHLILVLVLTPDIPGIRFESNMSPVSCLCWVYRASSESF